MNAIDRRTFLKGSVAIAGAVSRTASAASFASSRVTGIIDTNVNLFDWPFRRLKYRNTKALVAKLKKHRVIEAWAGSFDALFSKDISGTNARLAAECREQAPGFLIPVGTVNLAWPDWEEDLRRCHEVHKIPGVRLYPGYQPFDLDHPDMERFLKICAERGMVVQVVFGMEDPRVHHPIINVRPVTFRPLVKAIKAVPGVKVQLVHFPGSPQGEDFAEFLNEPNTFLEISRLEGNGAIGRMIGTISGLPSAHAPVERILFGSHAPYFPLETALLKLVESPLDAQQLHAIMQGNAERLLPRERVEKS
jgi:predicted TIM-barrel fold metal-dependent hydrolase